MRGLWLPPYTRALLRFLASQPPDPGQPRPVRHNRPRLSRQERQRQILRYLLSVDGQGPLRIQIMRALGWPRSVSLSVSLAMDELLERGEVCRRGHNWTARYYLTNTGRRVATRTTGKKRRKRKRGRRT